MEEGGFPPNEPIAFVFDEQKEFKGRAQRLYNSLRYSQGNGITYRHRLGSLTFDSRFCQLQLQAADVWAYESRKYVTDVLINKRRDGQRWQYELLRDTKRMNIRGFPPESLDKLVLLMRGHGNIDS
jgi:hypothetical protein